jgi:hypothetical protein
VSLITTDQNIETINAQAELLSDKELLIFGTEFCLSDYKNTQLKTMTSLIVNAYKKLGKTIYLDNICICINAVINKNMTCSTDLVLDWIHILNGDSTDSRIKKLLMDLTDMVVIQSEPNIKTIVKLLVMTF